MYMRGLGQTVPSFWDAIVRANPEYTFDTGTGAPVWLMASQFDMPGIKSVYRPIAMINNATGDVDLTSPVPWGMWGSGSVYIILPTPKGVFVGHSLRLRPFSGINPAPDGFNAGAFSTALVDPVTNSDVKDGYRGIYSFNPATGEPLWYDPSLYKSSWMDYIPAVAEAIIAANAAAIISAGQAAVAAAPAASAAPVPAAADVASAVTTAPYVDVAAPIGVSLAPVDALAPSTLLSQAESLGLNIAKSVATSQAVQALQKAIMPTPPRASAYTLIRPAAPTELQPQTILDGNLTIPSLLSQNDFLIPAGILALLYFLS